MPQKPEEKKKSLMSKNGFHKTVTVLKFLNPHNEMFKELHDRMHVGLE